MTRNNGITTARERVLLILQFLIKEGGKSYSELENRFSMFSKRMIYRDIMLLRDTKLVVEKLESRVVNGKRTRKVFIYFKDKLDTVGRTKGAMEKLREKGYEQVTLDMIASYAGLPPEEVKNHAYALAPKLKLLIGSEEREVPSKPLIVGLEKES